VSLGVYCSLSTQTQANLTFSYIIDKQQAVNFTLSSPAMASGQLIDYQLLMQTPKLSAGFHTLNMTFLGPSGLDGTITARQIIVQNSTSLVDLAAVPAIVATSSLSTPSPLSSSGHTTNPYNAKRISKGTISAISACALGFFIILILVFACYKRTRRKKRILKAQQPKHPLSPFSPPPPIVVNRFRIAQYTTAEKTEKYRQEYGFVTTQPPPPIPARRENGPAFGSIERPNQTRRVHYRVHEDGGRVGQENIGQVEIIDLPPVYNTITETTYQL